MCILFHQPDSVSQHAENKHPLSVQKNFVPQEVHTRTSALWEKKMDDISQILGSCT